MAHLGLPWATSPGKALPLLFWVPPCKGCLRRTTEMENGPARTLAHVNSTLGRNFAESRFATLVYGILQPDRRLVV